MEREGGNRREEKERKGDMRWVANDQVGKRNDRGGQGNNGGGRVNDGGGRGMTEVGEERRRSERNDGGGRGMTEVGEE